MNHMHDTNKTKLFLNPTPFHLMEGYQIRIENKNKNCSHNEIDALAAKGLLNTIDFEIMKLLGTYRYINTHNLEFALNQMLPTPYQKSDYKRNLKKLVSAGILLRHFICTADDNQLPRQIVSPLRFYSLSPGACTYISSLLDKPRMPSQAISDYRIIELLACSQLLIHFQTSYGHSVQKLLCNIHKQIGARTLLLDAYIRYIPFPKEQSSAVHLFLLCGRNQGDNYADLILRGHLLFRWLDQHKEEYQQHMILLLLENLPDISHVFLALRKPYGKETIYPLYFALDANTITYPLFDSLYQCETDDDSGKCQINRISIRLSSQKL